MKVGLVILIVIILVMAGLFVWYKYFFNLEIIDEKFVKAMTEDTYGGESAEETLELFIKALRSGDIELATKYFILDASLSRDKWYRTLDKFKERELLEGLANDIENNSGLVSLELNSYSNVWKIKDFK